MRLFAPSVSFVFDPNVNLSHASFVFVRYRESLYTSLPLIHPTHEKLDPYRFATSSPQMTSSRLIRGLYYSYFQCQIGLTNMYPSCILYFKSIISTLLKPLFHLYPKSLESGYSRLESHSSSSRFPSHISQILTLK